MERYIETNRSYVNALTGEKCKLLRNLFTDELILLTPDCKIIERFHATEIEQMLRFDCGTEVHLHTGQFISLKKNQKLTHRKYPLISKRWTKVEQTKERSALK